QLAEVLARVVDAETGQRGFVITGDDKFLEPYRVALADIDRVFTGVKQLTIDNANQQRRLGEIRVAIDGKLAELKRVIDERRANGYAGAATIIAAGTGREFMDSLRRLVADGDAEEVRLLAERLADADANSSTAKAVIVWGSIGGFLLIALIGF